MFEVGLHRCCGQHTKGEFHSSLRCISSPLSALILGLVRLLVAFLRFYSGCMMGNKTKAEAGDSVTGKDRTESLPGLANGNGGAELLPTSTVQSKVKKDTSEISECTAMTSKDSAASEEAATNTVVFGLDSAEENGTGLTDSAQGNGMAGTAVEDKKRDRRGEKEGLPKGVEDKGHPEHADKFDTDAVTGNGWARRNGKPVFTR